MAQALAVDSAHAQRTTAEVQKKNDALQEQLNVQRQLLRELEMQLHDSQRTCAQLRTQVRPSLDPSGAQVRTEFCWVCVFLLRNDGTA